MGSTATWKEGGRTITVQRHDGSRLSRAEAKRLFHADSLPGGVEVTIEWPEPPSAADTLPYVTDRLSEADPARAIQLTVEFARAALEGMHPVPHMVPGAAETFEERLRTAPTVRRFLALLREHKEELELTKTVGWVLETFAWAYAVHVRHETLRRPVQKADPMFPELTTAQLEQLPAWKLAAEPENVRRNLPIVLFNRRILEHRRRRRRGKEKSGLRVIADTIDRVLAPQPRSVRDETIVALGSEILGTERTPDQVREMMKPSRSRQREKSLGGD